MTSQHTRIDELAPGDVIQFGINNVYTVLSITEKKQRKGANPRLTMVYRYHGDNRVLTNDFRYTDICVLLEKGPQ